MHSYSRSQYLNTWVLSPRIYLVLVRSSSLVLVSFRAPHLVLGISIVARSYSYRPTHTHTHSLSLHHTPLHTLSPLPLDSPRARTGRTHAPFTDRRRHHQVDVYHLHHLEPTARVQALRSRPCLYTWRVPSFIYFTSHLCTLTRPSHPHPFIRISHRARIAPRSLP